MHEVHLRRRQVRVGRLICEVSYTVIREKTAVSDSKHEDGHGTLRFQDAVEGHDCMSRADSNPSQWWVKL
jgi:hypothetical protein